MIEALQFEFMRNALLAGVLVSIACGVIGTYVVLNRMVFISAGVAHAAYGGVGLGYLLGISPAVGAMGFSLLAALGMGAVQRKSGERADTLIGVMWAVGMAIGIILLDLTPGYKADLMSYLFGSILTVPTWDLGIMLALDAAILVLAILFHKELVAVSFDESFARVQNVPVDRIYLTLILLIALTVVMMMRVVGLILVIALITMPAAISAMFTRDLRKMMVVAGMLGVVFTTTGLWVSYTFDVTSGAAIILTAATGYLLALTARRLRRPRSPDKAMG